jgi:hypothetical protein
MSTEKKLWLIMAVFIGLGAYGVWNLFQPDVFPMSFVRGEVREAAPGVLVGPYPTEAELKILARNGVVEVISLMDPESVVESRLVEEEKKLVAAKGLRFENFPMDFQDMNGMKSAIALKEALQRISARGAGKLYVHCYLGRHRVSMIEAALKKSPGADKTP